LRGAKYIFAGDAMPVFKLSNARFRDLNQSGIVKGRPRTIHGQNTRLRAG
jgi:hypothetical protein